VPELIMVMPMMDGPCHLSGRIVIESMSLFGTSRTSPDVGLESVMRTKADVCQHLWIYEFTPSRSAVSRVQAAQGNQLKQRCLRTARLHRC
jgi:hypothetical protein